MLPIVSKSKVKIFCCQIRPKSLYARMTLAFLIISLNWVLTEYLEHHITSLGLLQYQVPEPISDKFFLSLHLENITEPEVF